MRLTDVEWVLDHQGHPFIRLRLDDRWAHIASSQRLALIRRGIVDGLVYFSSERPEVPNVFVQGDYAPELTAADLLRCTDDARVFALYQEMCQAIRAGTWQPGPRPALAQEQA